MKGAAFTSAAVTGRAIVQALSVVGKIPTLMPEKDGSYLV